MVNQKLVDYIKKELSDGYGINGIKQALKTKGWNPKEIEEAAKVAVPDMKADQKQRMKDLSAPMSGIKRRSPLAVVLLSFITFGIYEIYWLVVTTKELRKNTHSAPNPNLLWFLLIPLVNIVVMIIYYWKYCKAINELTGFDKVGLFLLWSLLPFVGRIISQIELNKKAD